MNRSYFSNLHPTPLAAARLPARGGFVRPADVVARLLAISITVVFCVGGLHLLLDAGAVSAAARAAGSDLPWRGWNHSSMLEQAMRWAGVALILLGQAVVWRSVATGRGFRTTAAVYGILAAMCAFAAVAVYVAG